MIDSDDDEFSDFSEGTGPRRRIGMATQAVCLNSIELSCRAEMFRELSPDIPFIESSDDEPEAGAPLAPQIPDDLDRVLAAIARYHLERCAIARSLGAGATEAAFKAACKANGV